MAYKLFLRKKKKHLVLFPFFSEKKNKTFDFERVSDPQTFPGEKKNGTFDLPIVINFVFKFQKIVLNIRILFSWGEVSNL